MFIILLVQTERKEAYEEKITLVRDTICSQKAISLKEFNFYLIFLFGQTVITVLTCFER
jgi:hypothetical protein